MHIQTIGQYQSLSDREKCCLSLAWSGKVFTAELGKFGLTAMECNTALQSAARKFEVSNPSEAVVRALRLNLLSPI